ncbi:hypothetical protein Tco_0573155 [Tanacetum coccineum]
MKIPHQGKPKGFKGLRVSTKGEEMCAISLDKVFLFIAVQVPQDSSSEKPRLYEIPYDTSDPANRFCPNGEETVTLEKESRSKLDKDKVKPYDYTYQNSLYETFKPPSKTYLDQLESAKQVRKTMWRKTFSRTQNLSLLQRVFYPFLNPLVK